MEQKNHKDADELLGRTLRLVDMVDYQTGSVVSRTVIATSPMLKDTGRDTTGIDEWPTIIICLILSGMYQSLS